MILAFIVASAFFMENLDATVITTALPQMARSFGVGAVDMSTGITAYVLALAVFIPASGWVADSFGARRVFGLAIVIFTLASLLCAASGSLPAFTAARVLQGMGGALMVPVGRMVVLRNTEKSQLMSAISTITWPGLAAPVIGPPIGGFITTYADWRWIFWLNLPLGIIAIALVAWLFPTDRAQQRGPFDLTGFILSGISLPCLMFGMDVAARGDGGVAQPLAAIAVAIVAGVLAVRHFARHPTPLLNLATLRVPTFAVSVWAGSISRMAINGIPFLVPLLLQVGFGLDAFTAGLLLLAVFAGNLGLKTITTPILRWFGFRRVLLVNGTLVGLTIAVCALFTPATPYWLMAIVLFIGGASRSMQLTCMATIQFADIPRPQMGPASTLSSMAQQLSIGLGVAIAAVVLHGCMALRHDPTPMVPDFRIAFLVVGAMGLLAVAMSWHVAPDAGAAVSGHAAARQKNTSPAARQKDASPGAGGKNVPQG